ncbi:uncharacterized protein LOC62_04G006596 [Vanrija pseudolonga]|uniref:Fucose-specific lectin n=1 Tax=Vanrija pseudolonga TaxID=143232 RepID=A0AAF1BM69_9TREE|nr:hypothetical protein LOC62_04G006596 [Vanrija pseudolonga]
MRCDGQSPKDTQAVTTAPTAYLPPNSPPMPSNQVVAISRDATAAGLHLDLFALGADGAVYTSWRVPGGEYTGASHEWLRLGHPPAGPLRAGTALTAVSRARDYIDVFVVAGDGNAYRASWAGTWGQWENISTALEHKFEPGASIAAVLRSPRHVDLFAVANGEVVTAFLVDGALTSAGQWYPLWRGADGPLNPGASIATASGGENDLVIFTSTGRDSVWARRWDGSWGLWHRVPFFRNTSREGPYVAAGAPLAVVCTAQQYRLYTVVEDARGARVGFATTGTGREHWPSFWGAGVLGGDDTPGHLAASSPVSAALEQAGDECAVRVAAFSTTGHALTVVNDTFPHEWEDAGGSFPPGSALALVPAARGSCHLFGVTNGRVYTRDVLNDRVVGEWRCIGGERGVRFVDASDAAATVPPSTGSAMPAPAPQPAAPPPAPPLDRKVFALRCAGGILETQGRGYPANTQLTLLVNWSYNDTVITDGGYDAIPIGRADADGNWTSKDDISGPLRSWFLDRKLSGVGVPLTLQVNARDESGKVAQKEARLYNIGFSA